jgi:hypothetical protein
MTNQGKKKSPANVERKGLLREVAIGAISATISAVVTGGIALAMQSHLQHENADLLNQLEAQKAEYQMQVEAKKATLLAQGAAQDAEIQKQVEAQKVTLQTRAAAKDAEIQKQVDEEKAALQAVIEAKKADFQKQLEEQNSVHQKEVEDKKAELERQRDQGQHSADSQKAAREHLIDHIRKVGELESAADGGFWRISFKNSCKLTIDVAVNYLALDGLWTTKGWWEIAPGMTADTEATRNRTFYHYAKSINSSPEWIGTRAKGGIDRDISDSKFQNLDNDVSIGEVDRHVEPVINFEARHVLPECSKPA